MADDRARSRVRVRVEGIVQGVGFRPFVYAVAIRLGLAGFVGNDAQGVFAEVEGDPSAIERFVRSLREDAPPLAVVEQIVAEPIEPNGDEGFRIAESDVTGERQALISPESSTCQDCLRELWDPADRRYRYPFINCTNCGPRFTIVTDVPYDRPFTTMAGFAMCAECAAEYRDPGDRRFHAQPLCCPACGPALRLVDRDGQVMGAEPIDAAARLIEAGGVVAVKGLGGFHLAADAMSERAVRTLRSRKHREDKPFAVMVADVEEARRLCRLDVAEERLLQSERRPIVLLRRLDESRPAPSVAPGTRSLGLMLPYTPLHELLVRELPAPLVLTSGNVSDEPIAYRDDDAIHRLSAIADAFLTHDRQIHMRTDDSVVRAFRDDGMILRRSRGYAPQPVSLPWGSPRTVLACGAELKSTFCLAKGRHAFVSHHIGDLENYETLRSFIDGIEHFRRLFDIDPQLVAHDLHPEYLSTKHALAMDGVDLIEVQHHHAHVASCLADNGERGPVIGVAFDGLGMGTDGTLWGGEFLVADLEGFERAGHLEPIPMPGGTAAIVEPWRMAAAYIAEESTVEASRLGVVRRNEERWSGVTALARAGVNSPRTSSAGRLFDAVSAILGVRDSVNYEGQAAIELEQRADPDQRGHYRARLEGSEPIRVQGTDLVRAVIDDMTMGIDVGTIAGRFHDGVARSIVDVSLAIRAARGLTTVALSGGVFQNMLLLERTVTSLDAEGFRVLVHRKVPPNDGGISLGQAAIAGAIDRAS